MKKLDLGNIDYKPFLKEFPGFENSFDEAHIGIPKSITKDADFFGTLKEAKQKYQQIIKNSSNLTTILYMEGSAPLSKAYTFSKWVVENNCIFFAPNSFCSDNLPVYNSPVAKEFYETVHTYRQAEICQFIDRKSELNIINTKSMFLMGNSEGALATARYSGDEFIARIVLSYNCEPGYFTDYSLVGANHLDDAFLNIMGLDDAFLGANNPWNNAYNNTGNAANVLFRFKNAKVVILPNTGHNVMVNQFTKEEVINFINRFKVTD